MNNKILENNLEFLKELEGLTYKEIQDKSKEEAYSWSYNSLIMTSLKLYAFNNINDTYSGIHIDNEGDVFLHIDKFSLDFNNYEISYDDNIYENEKEAIDNVKFTWLKEQLIKAHNYAKFKEYGDKLQQLVDLGYDFSNIEWMRGAREVEVTFNCNNQLRRGSSLYFDWPEESIPYLRERFYIIDNEE